MKKLFALLILFALCLSMGACGKSEEVKSVEAMIEALGAVTKDSGNAICAIDDAYEALTEEEQKKVRNYHTFLQEKEAYYELTIAGIWYPCDLNLYELEHHFAPRFYLELKEDMTAISYTDYRGACYGTWDVTEGDQLHLSLEFLDTETSSSVPGVNDYFSFTLNWIDGKLRLGDHHIDYVRQSEYFPLLSEAVLAVDCTQDDFDEYFTFTTATHTEVDEWGSPTGNTYERVLLQNKLFDEGWVYMCTSEDFALEVTYPAHTETYVFRDGSTNTHQYEADSYTVLGSPFHFFDHSLTTSWTSPEHSCEKNIGPEDLSFGRRKGTIYFLNSSYIKEIRPCQEGGREILLDTDGDHLFQMQESVTQDMYIVSHSLDY